MNEERRFAARLTDGVFCGGVTGVTTSTDQPTRLGAGFSVVLVEPSLPENVGAVARVMGNLGARELRLVRPCAHLSGAALRVATHSGALLRAARVFPSLAEAVRDCHWVAATSARPRDPRQPTVNLPGLGRHWPAAPARTALVFGRESRGLTAEELAHAHLCVRIPTPGDAPAFNLSHAVAVTLYELAREDVSAPAAAGEPPARGGDVEGLKQHGLALLERVGFLKPRQAPRVRRRFSALLARWRPTAAEVRWVRGFFHRVELTLDRASRAEEKPNPEPRNPPE